jgi:60 kDa SS-A/Ro ribonucleoprotein
MAKFNEKVTVKTQNTCGNQAYDMTPKTRLVFSVLTNFVNENKYYGDTTQQMLSDLRQVIQQDPEFVGRLAIYTRTKANMRSVSHVIAGELAKHVKDTQWVKGVISQVCTRPDDMTEIMAYYLNTYGKPIPACMKKGLAKAFTGFDAYQLGKWNRDGQVKLRDVMFLCCPKPVSVEQEEVFKLLASNELEKPETWEKKLSADGNTEGAWAQLLAENKLGIMALLRNLRNILQSNPNDAITQKVHDMLRNEVVIRGSKQLPFRFYSAYTAIQGLGGSKMMDSLDIAAKYACGNVDKLPGRTVIVVDASGSMNSPISDKSDVRCIHIASILAAMANHICDDSIIIRFGSAGWGNSKAAEVITLPSSSILSAARGIVANMGGTDMHAPFRLMMQNSIRADRIIVLSDNEVNRGGGHAVQSSFEAYKNAVACDPWLHAIDLQGYGTQQFIGRKINLMAGWSDKILNIIPQIETGGAGLIEEINKIVL